jgi:hypothetical protein
MSHMSILLSTLQTYIVAKKRCPQVKQSFATYITPSFETRGPYNQLHIVLDAGHPAVSVLLTE